MKMIDFEREGFIPVTPDDVIKFQCSRCGDCCRNVKESVIVEPLDLFRIARFFGKTTDDVMEEYTTALRLAWGYPMLTLKIKQHMDACVFLRAGKCGIYEARPRACRTYPLGTGPDDEKPGAFLDLIVSKKQHHFTGESVRVRDWMGQNINDEDRAFILASYTATGELAEILQRFNGRREPSVMFQMMFYMYGRYNTAKDFMPQFSQNMAYLKNSLVELSERG